MLDLTKLTPAPWNARTTDCGWVAGPNGHPVLVAENDDDEGQAAVAFAALARVAFDVMTRRNWEPELWLADPGESKWGVESAVENLPDELFLMRWPDPYTALVEADLWYATNIERKSP